jgi:hypothetical protein
MERRRELAGREWERSCEFFWRVYECCDAVISPLKQSPDGLLRTYFRDPDDLGESWAAERV